MHEFIRVLLALPGLFYAVLFSFLGSGTHAARNRQVAVVEGLLGFLTGAPVALTLTKGFMLMANAYLDLHLEWDDMWLATFWGGYWANDVLGGADAVGSEFRQKPIPFLIDLLTNVLLKGAAALQALRKTNDTTPS
ncbi:hypothetical protein FAES_3632 [Fibrella aestuarina BUZ 2]|uniref:Uncharacterized protein n=1 Tax=Fibrella aestuarina BUZ 2 TaxID=1166018 RepID=I0KBY6_9BACT|nr:hypothetical protein [Fibrella aestuarina]CCH01639.1 hypothetical protein FAES_3632 [Fibrella aestuarina BUZ 2]